jgi:hypothetical protein
MGEMTPGKSTVLRIGITMSASAGSGFETAEPRAPALAAEERSCSSFESSFGFMRGPSCGT